MFEVIFLFLLGLAWIIFATVQDVRTKEIANWLNFSLIIFVLGFRFFYSLFSAGNFSFFYQGIIGLVIFFVLGNLLYYGRMFAGGDAKLLIALGPLIFLSDTFSANFWNFVMFLLIFLFAGALYSITVSVSLGIKNRKKFGKEFRKQFKENSRIIVSFLLLSIILIILSYLDGLFLYFGILTFILPYLYIYTKSVDEISMIKNVPVSELEEGDWLYHDVHVGRKTIKATWDGLNKSEINLLRKKGGKVKIRNGVAFTPVFIISYLIFFYLLSKGLGNSFW